MFLTRTVVEINKQLLLSFAGVDLPGFLPGSNFLLPWDICVKTEQEKWPTVSETFGVVGMKRQLRKSTKGNACWL